MTTELQTSARKHSTRLLALLFAIAAMAGLAANPAAAESGDAIDLDLTKYEIEQTTFDFSDWFVFNQAPQFNNYLQCVNGWVYADFIDPDGTDANLHVDLWTSWTGYRTMNVSTGYHGTYWYDQIPAPATSGTVWVRATDPLGAKTSWVTMTMNSSGGCAGIS